MENASKALIIAGGILIAILILSLLVYVGTNTSRLARTQDEAKLASQTAEFNRQYESYNNKLLYGAEVLTVYNKAKDYNERFNLGADGINIEICDNNGNPLESNNIDKTDIFRCTEIEYSSTSGKVSKMTFIQQNIDD